MKNQVASIITKEDAKLLQADSSPENRAMIAQKIAGQFCAKGFATGEKNIVMSIFRVLMSDKAEIVRIALAEEVSDSEELPKDIAFHLANDENDKVALPILEQSPVLTDEDLVKIIETTKHTDRQIAISKRKKLSKIVSESLIKTDNADVVSSLVQNEGADIAEKDIQKILIDHKLDDNITSSLAKKNSKSLQNLRMIHGDNLTKAINHFYNQNALTPTVVITLLCMGNLEFFYSALAKITGLNLNKIHEICNHGTKEQFTALYLKAAMPDILLEAVYLLYSVSYSMERTGEKEANRNINQYLNRLMEHLSEEASGKNIDSIDYIISLIRNSAAAN